MLSAKDRSVLIRLASVLPKGSAEKKAVLNGLAKTAALSDEDYFVKTLKDDFGRRAITKEEYLNWNQRLKDLEEDSQVSGLVDDYMRFRKNRSASDKKAGSDHVISLAADGAAQVDGFVDEVLFAMLASKVLEVPVTAESTHIFKVDGVKTVAKILLKTLAEDPLVVPAGAGSFKVNVNVPTIYDKKAEMSPKAFWLLHIAALDKAMPKYNTAKVTDWNKVMKHYRGLGLRDAGPIAQSYHEYRHGTLTKEQAASEMAESHPNAQLTLGVPL